MLFYNIKITEVRTFISSILHAYEDLIVETRILAGKTRVASFGILSRYLSMYSPILFISFSTFSDSIYKSYWSLRNFHSLHVIPCLDYVKALFKSKENNFWQRCCQRQQCGPTATTVLLLHSLDIRHKYY